jgi:hypothetical protein
MRAHVGHEPIQYLALADPANQTGPLLTPHHAHRPDDDGPCSTVLVARWRDAS